VFVEESDPDEGYSDVRRRLAVIAGEDTQTTRIDRHRVVEPELGAEVGDGPVEELAVVLREPRVAASVLALELFHHTVVDRDEFRVASAVAQPAGVDAAEE
jgi:hypothetical protein